MSKYTMDKFRANTQLVRQLVANEVGTRWALICSQPYRADFWRQRAQEARQALVAYKRESK